MQTKARNIIYCLCFILLTVSAQRAYAGTDNSVVTVLDGSKNQIAKDSAITSADSLFFSGTFSPYLVKPYPVQNIISFHINEQALVNLPDSFKAIVHVRLYYIDSASHLDSLNDLRLAIDYKASAVYTARTSFIFGGAYSVKVKVLSDTIPAAVMSALVIENEITPSRDYVFSCTNTVSINPSINFVSATADELTVSWANRIGVDETDVEWAFIDSSALASGLYTVGGSFNPDLIFTNNATRITVAALSYNIPLIFPGAGSVFVRARAVQLSNGKRTISRWTSDFLPSGMLKYNFSGHEKNLNWQSSVSFAEEGKRKVVVQYFDGSLRSRQTVTKDNSINATVTAEKFYDYQGRPAIQVLPSPSINSIIKYTANFNRYNGAEYDKSVFDSVIYPNTACSLVAPSMDSTYGAAWYYSSNNALAGSGFSRYIPQSYGYAFTQTEYTQDNTGRISRQSGVGQDFMLNTGHETKYYYSITPDQNELDALFGTEAGDHTHYFKNAVRDANGQYSVSYVDMHGRTVATALAGHTPAVLSKLSSNSPSTVTQTLADAGTNVTDGLSMTSHKSLLVTMAGPQHFVYALSPQSFQEKDCSNTDICYDCLYDMAITITDDCNNQKLGGHPLVITRPNIAIADAVCNGTGISVDTTINLDEGEYQITKTLTVSKAKQKEYFDNVYLPHNTCKTLADFIKTQQQLLPHGNCDITCVSCRESVGSLTTFGNSYMTKVYGDTTGKALHQAEIQAAYNSALEACDAYCDDSVYTATDFVRQAMLEDMSPQSGQYADPDSALDIHSIFYKPYSYSVPIYRQVTNYKDETGQPDSVFDNVAGKKVPPQQLDATQFSDNFKPSWAESLLSYHPEYCKLQAYENHYSAYTWQKKFEVTTSYADAVIKGYNHPLSSGVNQDPLAADATFSSNLSSKYNSYTTATKGSNTQVLSMWQVAILGVKCPQGDTVCIQNIVFTTHDYSLPCAADSNQAWRSFQQLYSAYRTELLNNYYTGINCTVPTSQLLADNHLLHFNTSTAVITGNSLGFTSSTSQQVIRDSGMAHMKAAYQSNCEAYKTIWTQQLLPGYQGQVNTILPMLVDVCVAGSDADHPFGSRDISTDSPSVHEIIGGNNYQVRSFDDVINSYNAANNIALSDTRNADVITMPDPYYKKQAYTQPVVSAPSTSQCDLINFYHSAYQSSALPGETFSQYMKRTQNTDISDDDLQSLVNSCAATGPCKYLDHPIILPPVFQPGVANACTDCYEFSNLVAEYINDYGDSFSPAIADQTDTTQLKANILFTNFMNNRLGYSLSITDYLNFMNQCQESQSKQVAQSMRSQVSSLTCNNWARFLERQPGIQIGDLDVPGNHITVEALFNRINDTIPIDLNAGDIVSKHNDIRDVNYLLRPYGVELTTTTGYHHVGQICSFDTNKTYHVALVYDGQYLKFYRDGLLVNEDTCTGNLILNNWITTIGSTAGPSSETHTPSDFRGYINEVRIWNIARTQEQIKQYMYSSLMNPATQAGLLAYYIFDSLKNRQGNTSWDGELLNNTIINQTNPLCSLTPDACDKDITPSSQPLLCGGSQPAYPITQLDAVNNCTDSTFFAVSTGTEMYNHYLDSLKGSFDSLYFAKCLQAYKYETFTVTDTLGEYQYTLYYYDQAGNLVQTIPPKAVRPNWNATYLAQVKVKRAAGDTLRPGHDLNLATQYRYNTLNQVVAQKSPDGGTSAFYYDRLGRLVLSQNAKQSPSSKYSYTAYDPLGRITEVGELANTAAMNSAVSKIPAQLGSWLTGAAASRTQITHTAYDIAYYGIDSVILIAKNLRNRVSYVQYFKTDADQYPSDNHPKPQAGTFYTYDIAGNVDTLLQDFVIGSLPSGHNRFFKKIVYDYDLISGKVNSVAYNPGQPDAFYHRYTYDAENRITNVETSADNTYWENEAFYKYYYHGPLARTVLGENQVQGVDYAYTLQGWLKGINSSSAGSAFDMGNDGYAIPTAYNQYIARDVYGFALHYFSNDYKTIYNLALPFAKMNTTVLPDFKPLYNGNIAAISQDQSSFAKPLLFAFGYDQLNRLTQMRAYKNNFGTFDLINNWTPAAINDYSEDISYDANGNILKYKRYANSTNTGFTNAAVMDSLNYYYEPNTNRLDRISDNVTPAKFSVDIDNQPADNYSYDAIGNLIRDSAENIKSITWNVYGKIQQILKRDNSTITYYYDASGNRLGKVVAGASSGNGETWYVHDASGNVMAVYTVNDNTVNSGALTLSEQSIYGSSRLGIYRPALNLATAYNPKRYITGVDSGYYSNFTRGIKLFELTNHLGNVLTTITDKKIGVYNGNGVFNHYDADVVTANDYYPFGMTMPGRSFTASSSTYRYGFNGKENDNEVKGTGNQQDYGMRMYDTRIGRFLSVDPIAKEYPELTPYQFASNRPIDGIDQDGLEFLNNFKAQQAKQAGAIMFNIQQPKYPAPVLRPTPQASIERHANHVEYTNFNLGKFLFMPGWSYKYLQYNLFNDAHIVYTSFRDGGRNATDLDYNSTTEKQRMSSFINLASTAATAGEIAGTSITLSRVKFATGFYESVGGNVRDISGINFYNPVSNVSLNSNTKLYQWTIDGKLGDYFTTSPAAKNLGLPQMADGTPAYFDQTTNTLKPRTLMEIKLPEDIQLKGLKSTSMDINAWGGAPGTNNGGNVQIYAPQVKVNSPQITPVQ